MSEFNGQNNNNTTEKVAEKANNIGVGLGKQAGKNVGKKAMQAASKAMKKVVRLVWKIIKSVLIAILPYIFGIAILVGVVATGYTFLFENRGTEQSYTLDETAYENETELGNKGSTSYNKATDFSKENQMVQTFYQYEGANSIFKTKDGKELYSKKDNETEFNDLKDLYSREKQFYLGSDFLYVLDSQMHEGEIIYPEQFIQPVYYDPETFKLKMLTEKNAKGNKSVVAESTRYDKKTGLKYNAVVGEEYNQNGDYLTKEDSDKMKVADKKGIIYIGDNRMNSMEKSITKKNNEYFIDDIGDIGYKWFNETAIDKVDDIINTEKDKREEWKIVFNLGINDLDNADKYVEKINELMEDKWGSYKIYIMSVNPTKDNKNSISNDDIETFNESLKSGINNITYIDTYSAIKETFATEDDGITLDGTTLKKIYSLSLDETDNNDATSSKSSENKSATKVKGVWDYGLAPILKYGDYEIIHQIEGVWYAEDREVDDDDGEGTHIEMVDYAEEKPFDPVIMEGYPQKVNLIDDVVLFMGNIHYEYRIEDSPFDVIHDGETSDEREPVEKVKYGETESEESLYRYRRGTQNEVKPVQDSTNTDFIDDEYLKDYIYNYIAWVPKTVMEGFDFKKRTNEDWDKIKSNYTKKKNGSGIAYEMEEGSMTDELKAAIQSAGPYMDEAAAEFGIGDTALMYALIAQESGGKASEITGGAVGLMQVEHDRKKCALNSSGEEVCMTPTTSELLDPKTNVRAGCLEFASYLQREDINGDYLKAMYAYNCGPGSWEYIKKNHPESIDSSDWMNYREEARQASATADGYPNSCSAGDTECKGTVWGDSKYIERIMRNYVGDGNYMNGNTGGSVNTSAMKKKGFFDKLWSKLKDSVGTLFKNDYMKTDKRAEIKTHVASDQVDTIIQLTLAFQKQELYSETDAYLDEFWKTGYSVLFEQGQLFNEDGETIPEEMKGMGSPLDDTNPTISMAYGADNSSGKAHLGVDVAQPEGTDVKAIEDGKVSSAKTDKSLGNCIEIKHSNGTVSKYCSLGTMSVKKGDEVKKGDVIGTVGTNKENESPHLHFEFLIKGKQVNPTAIVNGSASVMGGGEKADSESVEKGIQIALSQCGKKYVFGACGPDTFDCSGLIYYSMRAAGVDFNARTTWTQMQVGTAVSKSDVKRGDLIFTRGGEHVGWYLGNNKWVAAPHTGDVVKIQDISNQWNGVYKIIRLS